LLETQACKACSSTAIHAASEFSHQSAFPPGKALNGIRLKLHHCRSRFSAELFAATAKLLLPIPHFGDSSDIYRVVTVL
jgi:hypothetical protein